MQDKIFIYNSLTRKKELFVPIHSPNVGLYVCGPTVYNDVHLGNVRTFMSFDMIYRYLKYSGYKVRYVRNITDAGHLTNDAGEGVNRMESQAKLEQLEPMEIVQKYTVGFHKVCTLFNLLPPTIEPTATGHIIEQIKMAEQLIENGYAYEVNGSVYFDVKKFSESYQYGELSGRNIEDIIAGYRDLDGQEEKRNSIDFALWKKASPMHIMRWDSPWGEGFPGWHLECSAMSTKYLGKTFDIHGGGMDLKFPHHECEIAQNLGSVGQQPVNYWMHSNMLNFNGQKMSKSLGNSILPLELVTGNHPLLDKAYSPMTVRFLFLLSHYSSELDISIKALQDAEKGYRKLMNALDYLPELTCLADTIDNTLDNEIQNLCTACIENMNDDFNTPKAISNLYAIATQINIFYNNEKKCEGISSNTFELMQKTYKDMIFEVLGLENEATITDNATLNTVMQLVIELRNEARTNKNWSISDKIRDNLKIANIQLKDNKDGTTTYEKIL